MSLRASIRRAKLLFLTGLFLVCMCSLMLQIMETRLLSVIAWYYLAFFAISIAMFGMTAGSLFVYFKASLFPPSRLFEHLSWIGSAFAIAVIISTLSMISTVVLAGLTSAMMALLWFKLILIILPPYVFAGMAISLALTQSPWPVGIVYGVDLIGAATGCLLVLGMLTWMDGVSALLAVGAIGAAAAACFRAAWRGYRDAAMRELPMSRWFVLRYPAVVAGTARDGGLVQQFASASRGRAHASKGPAGNGPARSTAMELVLPDKGGAGNDRRTGDVGTIAEHAAGGSATAHDEH